MPVNFYVHVADRSLATLQNLTSHLLLFIDMSHARHINKQEQVRGQILIREYYSFPQCQES